MPARTETSRARNFLPSVYEANKRGMEPQGIGTTPGPPVREKTIAKVIIFDTMNKHTPTEEVRLDRVMKISMILGVLLSVAVAGCANRGGAANAEQRSSKTDAISWDDDTFVPFDESSFVVSVEPEASLVEPGDPYAVTVSVAGNASPVSYVELFLDGESVGQQNIPPYRFEGWFAGDSAFELVALTKLEDNSSAVSAPVSIKISR